MSLRDFVILDKIGKLNNQVTSIAFIAKCQLNQTNRQAYPYQSALCITTSIGLFIICPVKNIHKIQHICMEG